MRARLRDAPIFYDFGRVCRELWIVIFFGGGNNEHKRGRAPVITPLGFACQRT